MTAEMEKICNKRDSLVAKGKELVAQNKFEELKTLNDEIKAVDAQIDELEKFENSQKEDVVVVAKPVLDSTKKFNSFGEQIRAIMEAGISRGSKVDPRLVKDDIKGANTIEGADGGYAIQEDFLGNILDIAFENSEIARRCTERPVSANANRVKYTTVDDMNDAETLDGIIVAGGVRMYWAEEGKTVPDSKPKFATAEIELNKMMGFGYATSESLQDIPFLSSSYEEWFGEAAAGLLTDGILNGKGKSSSSTPSEPLGIFNSNAIVEVKPQSNKITGGDFTAMKARMRKKNWTRAAWFIHPDLEEELPFLKDENGNQLYMPEGGLSGQQYATILGRPIIYDEFMAAKGEKGSILLADFKEYLLIKKGEARKDWSMHVEFLTDQQCFRLVMRVGGAPMRNGTYAVRNSSNKRAAFVTLGKMGE